MGIEDELGKGLFGQEDRASSVFGEVEIGDGSDVMSGFGDLQTQLDLHYFGRLVAF